MNCPRCGQLLYQRVRDRFRARTCDGCGGVWVDGNQAFQVANIVEVAQSAGELAEDAGSRAPFGGSIGTGNIRCPGCAALMTRVHFPRADVVLDSCGGHGTWFDRGELQKVARLVGGPPDQNRKKLGPFRTSLASTSPGGVGPGAALPRQAAPAGGGLSDPEPPVGIEQVVAMICEMLFW